MIGILDAIFFEDEAIFGVGDGGGVASERARVCGVLWCGTRGYHNLGQIQHICASLTPRVGIGAAMLDGQYFGVWRWYATIWGECFFLDLSVRLSAPDVLGGARRTSRTSNRALYCLIPGSLFGAFGEFGANQDY